MTIRCITCREISTSADEMPCNEGPFEAFGVKRDRHTVIDTCPRCGSEDIEYVTLCGTCEQEPAAPGYDDCEVCVGIAAAEQTNGARRVVHMNY